MIFPLAKQFTQGVDASQSLEEMHNCWSEPNDEGSKFPATIRFREGLELTQSRVSTPSDVLGFDSIDSAPDMVVLTRERGEILDGFGRIKVSWQGNYKANTNPITYGSGSKLRVFYSTEDGLVYYDKAASSIIKHDASYITGALFLANLNGYLVVITNDKIYLSDYNEFENIRALSHLTTDGRIPTGAVVYNDELWVFYQSSIQVYTLSGDSTIPLAPVPSAHYDIKSQFPQPITFREQLYFIDSEYNVMRVSGYSFTVASTSSVRRKVSGRITKQGMFINESWLRGFPMLVLPTGWKTLCLNLDTNLWHTESFNSSAVDYADGPSVIGGFNNIMILTDGYYKRARNNKGDNGRVIKYRIISPPFHAERKLQTIRYIGFDFGSETARLEYGDKIEAEVSIIKEGYHHSIRRKFTVNRFSAQRNRQYNLGAARTMSIQLDIDGGFQQNLLTLSGCEIG